MEGAQSQERPRLTMISLFALLLRVLGIWALFWSFADFADAAREAYNLWVSQWEGSHWVPFVTPAVELLFGVALVRFSPQIAGWIHSKPGEDPIVATPAIDARDAWTIGARLLGFYAILWAIAPLSEASVALAETRRDMSQLETYEIVQLIDGCLLVFYGTFLVLAAGPLGRSLAARGRTRSTCWR